VTCMRLRAFIWDEEKQGREEKSNALDKIR
jgi:hypothetical protein